MPNPTPIILTTPFITGDHVIGLIELISNGLDGAVNVNAKVSVSVLYVPVISYDPIVVLPQFGAIIIA